jgi:hydrogenase maturation factor
MTLATYREIPPRVLAWRFLNPVSSGLPLEIPASLLTLAQFSVNNPPDRMLLTLPDASTLEVVQGDYVLVHSDSSLSVMTQTDFLNTYELQA